MYMETTELVTIDPFSQPSSSKASFLFLALTVTFAGNTTFLKQRPKSL